MVSDSQSVLLAEEEIVFQDAWVINRVGQYGRRAVHIDALESRLVERTDFLPQTEKGVVLSDGTTAHWKAVRADEDGWLKDDSLRGGYAHYSITSDRSRVMLLDATGHRMVYVNGQPRIGDVYMTNMVRIPVFIKAGTNSFLFHGARGRLRARLIPVEHPVMLDLKDVTLPDLTVDTHSDTWGAVVVVNATTSPLKDMVMVVTVENQKSMFTSVATVPPLSIRKTPFRIRSLPVTRSGDLKLTLRLQKNGREVEESESYVTLRVRHSHQTYKKTFISTIDGSVQYYAVRPASSLNTEESEGTKSLFLTLHGAGVEALGQVNAYSAKSWGHLVAPTNRRPFGFDWEDWGRIDAMEVLSTAQHQLDTDPQRTYLTGHSMGGHGTWQLGAIYPDRFAAIGPSAGWISFDSYVRSENKQAITDVENMLSRARSSSNTLAMADNYLQSGVYILHGGEDRNVPADEARTMNRHLEQFHRDFVYFEQPGVGHWWDASPEPGADCVDWAPMFDFFLRRVIPVSDYVRRVQFVTVNPGISSRSHWVTIAAQKQQLQTSRADLRFDPGNRRFSGSTENIARMELDVDHVTEGGPIQLDLDGDHIEYERSEVLKERIYLQQVDEKWELAHRVSTDFKGPHRYGPFKEVFRKNVVFVYGTTGTSEENQWAFVKARFDAETFWYRGNGAIEVIPDHSFDPELFTDRNVVIYGHAESNSAWNALLTDSPIQVSRDVIRMGDKTLANQDIGCLFVRPRSNTESCLIGVVTGTNVIGMRSTDRLPYFVSGVSYPDLFVITPEVLVRGSDAVIVTGFFGLDWSLESGQFAWNLP